MPSMAAAVATARRQIQCREVPAPAPVDGKVLVRTELASICGSDLKIVYTEWVNQFPMAPGHPGHEGVGEVVDGGDTGVEAGRVVLTVPRIGDNFGFAAYQLIDPGQLLALPSGQPHHRPLMAQQLGTVVFACKLLPPLGGKTAVVVGQGSAGLFHDFILRRMGAERIIAVEPVPERLALSATMGADDAIDVTGAPATEAVLDLTGGLGADVVIDAVGTVETLNQTLRLARDGGRIAAFGLPTTSRPVPFEWDVFFRKSLTIHAVHGSQKEAGLPDFRLAMDMIANGEIDVSPLLTHTLPISAVQEGFDLADSRDDGAIKVSLTF